MRTGSGSASTYGSPPRVWGRPLIALAQCVNKRFTPTRVGTTQRRQTACDVVSVHPHACGDDFLCNALLNRGFGSPPRVWGRLSLNQFPDPGRRFTPTRVGTTLCVHCNKGLGCGSPPRVWGRRLPPPVVGCLTRFTPTRVGTTDIEKSARRLFTVHPHACGDDVKSVPTAKMFDGSPPRVWGRPQNQTRVVGVRRFTPTRVGTTSAIAFSQSP